MTRKSNNSTLLSLLQSLYSTISQAVAEIRMRSYRLFDQSNKRVDITGVLNKQIGDLAASAVKEAHHGRKSLDNVHQHELTHKNTEKEQVEGQNGEDASSADSEFAQYLKQRKTSSVTQPYVGDKLTASVWEHIHSAVRSARQGDVDTAKLHTKIAGQALEEAGHYLNDKDYSELVFQIEHYITEPH